MFGTIVVGYDGSECARRALDVAEALARPESSKIALCSVVDPLPKVGGLSPSAAGAALTAAEDEARRFVEDGSARLDAAGISHEAHVLLGDPVREILRYAVEAKADAIVVGSHGRTGLRRLLVGSVAEGVLRSASVPVVIVRESALIAATPTSE
jgi:nucleotide-binding universal stress UspA family protein